MSAIYVLILLAGYLWLAIKITHFTYNTVRTRYGKWMALVSGLLCVVLMALIPIWDELLTLSTFKQSCKEEAGIRVYSKMGLPAKLFDEHGEPLFVKRMGSIDGSLNERGSDDKTDLYQHVQFTTENETLFRAGLSAVYKTSLCLRGREKGQLLSCETWVAATPGWFSSKLLSFAGGTRGRILKVPNCREYTDFRVVHQSIFFVEPAAK